MVLSTSPVVINQVSAKLSLAHKKAIEVQKTLMMVIIDEFVKDYICVTFP